MSPERQALVRESWKLLAAKSEAMAPVFYEQLFELNPASKALFASTDMEQQGRKLMRMLESMIQALDDEDYFVRELAALGRRHVEYGARDVDYGSVGAALLATLESALGDRFTPEVRDAWAETYRLMAGVMRRAAGNRGAPAVANG